LGKLVPFMMNYFFVCKNCSPTGLENFKKNQASEYKYLRTSTL
jgi:Set1/Ash2 histone methyltransferase complex subunit ASH2